MTSSAEHNIQIVLPTTSAQFFHVLRRQVKRLWRKPLVVFTPKSLLREPFVMSPLQDLTTGRFQRVLPDTAITDAHAPERILLTTGKVGVDLLKLRKEQNRTDFAVIRIEQVYPLPHEQIRETLLNYARGLPVYWVQEEPRNMGAWYFMKVKWDELGLSELAPLNVVCRPESASPSTGSKKTHKIEQAELLQEAMGVAPRPTAAQA